jgi:hypothetical protein
MVTQTTNNPQTVLDFDMKLDSDLTLPAYEAIYAALDVENYWGKRVESSKQKVVDIVSTELTVPPSIVRDVADGNGDQVKMLRNQLRQREDNIKHTDLQNKAKESGSVTSRINEMGRIKSDSGYFIITGAQNATAIHEPFFNNLKAYAEYLKAPLLIGGFKYRTGNAWTTENYYIHELSAYMVHNDVFLSDNLLFAAEANINPSAKNPLSGWQNYGNDADLILPHSKYALQAHPTPKDSPAKHHYTTGTVTKRHYINRKAGQTAEPNHCFGALLVYIDENGDHFVRQLQAQEETGTFFDFDHKNTFKTRRIENGQVITIESIAGLQLGDVHAEKAEKDALAAAIHSIIHLRPKMLFLHDLLDFESRNHHNIGDAYFMAKQAFDKSGVVPTVEGDLSRALEILGWFNEASPNTEIVVVESNHDVALKRWLLDRKYESKNDPINAELYHLLQAKHYNDITNGVSEYNQLKLAFEVVLKKQGKELPDWFGDTYFHNVDESVLCEGIECGMHGDKGANGARGSSVTFAKQSPSNTGHTHQAGINYPNFSAGVLGLDFGYNQGLSSWSVSFILTFEGGTRQIITYYS